MSILDRDIEEQSDIMCSEHIKGLICDFVEDHMCENSLQTWHNLPKLIGTPGAYIPGENSSFAYSYYSSKSPVHNPYNYQQKSVVSYLGMDYVRCCYPILDLNRCILWADTSMHHPFIIHDYDGESLPYYIKFGLAYIPKTVDKTIDDGIVYNREQGITILVHDCPNLRIKDPNIRLLYL